MASLIIESDPCFFCEQTNLCRSNCRFGASSERLESEMQKITPFLWFDGQAEQAAHFYLKVFGENAKITNVMRLGEDAPGQEGAALTVTVEIFGHKFVGLNGGPHYSFTPAVSFMVDCDSQEEIDRYWDQLAEGGEPLQCGWVTDKYGITWQITPGELLTMLQAPDPEKSKRTMDAMMKMVKLDLPGLRKAYAGE